MTKRITILLALLLSGCVAQRDFQTGALNCHHTVSTQMFGTAQVVSCDVADQPVYVNSFPGTPGVEPAEKLIEAGAMAGSVAGVLSNLPRSVTTDSVIHIRP